MQLNTVVLPAPFGPISAVMSPCARVERQVVDGDKAAEAHGQMFDPQQDIAGLLSSAVPFLDELGGDGLALLAERPRARASRSGRAASRS